MGLLRRLAAGLQLLLGAHLRRAARVLDGRLAKDDITVRSGRLVHFGLGDDVQNVTGRTDRHALDTGHALQSEALEGLARFAFELAVQLDVGILGDVVGVVEREVLEGHFGCFWAYWDKVERGGMCRSMQVMVGEREVKRGKWAGSGNLAVIAVIIAGGERMVSPQLPERAYVGDTI